MFPVSAAARPDAPRSKLELASPSRLTRLARTRAAGRADCVSLAQAAGAHHNLLYNVILAQHLVLTQPGDRMCNTVCKTDRSGDANSRRLPLDELEAPGDVQHTGP